MVGLGWPSADFLISQRDLKNWKKLRKFWKFEQFSIFSLFNLRSWKEPDSVSESCSSSPTGGNQVDGLPPVDKSGGFRSKMVSNLKKFVADFDETKMSQSRMYMWQYVSIGRSRKNLEVSKSLKKRPKIYSQKCHFWWKFEKFEKFSKIQK